MKLIQVSVLLLSLSAITAHAEISQCVGQDGAGNAIHALLDSDTETLNVNGVVLQINDITAGHNGVATEMYTADNGQAVYDSIVIEQHRIVLYQFDAATNEVMSVVYLACQREFPYPPPAP